VAERKVSAEFVFDRASEQTLAQAYRILVPERRARTVQRRDVHDHDQTSTAGLGGARELQLVAHTGTDEDRPALGA
jgi:hypothetical protein